MTPVVLPSGLWRRGVHHRVAWLRPLAGIDEEMLCAQAQAGIARVEMATELLARCVERLGELDTPERAAISDLTVGDREALLLHLRRLTLGDRLQCVVDCPACGEPMDLDLNTRDLLLPPYADPRPHYEMPVPLPDRRGEGIGVEARQMESRLRFRLPTGTDLAAIAALAGDSPAEARDALIARCLDDLCAGETGGAHAVLTSAIAQALADAMAQLDPQAEIVLDMTCPACAHAFAVLFDATEYLFRELAMDTDRLYREVHALAMNYHWSEAAILALPRGKRRRYLALLDETAAAAMPPRALSARGATPLELRV